MNSIDGDTDLATAGQQVASATADKAAEVSQQAAAQTKAVASTAVDQGRQVGDQVKAQARDLMGETREQARRQANAQTQQVGQALARIRDQGRALVAGRPQDAGSLPGLAEQGLARLDPLVERIQIGGFEGVAGDVQRFARRRPGTFLLGAALMGFGLGRLIRAGAIEHATGQQDSPSAPSEPFFADEATMTLGMEIPGAGPSGLPEGITSYPAPPVAGI